MIDWVGTFSIVGTIVLILILVQQSLATWAENKERRNDRMKEGRETPHFKFAGFKFDSETIKVAILKEKQRVLNVKVLKAMAINEGELLAVNSSPFLALGDSPQGWSTVWTTHLSRPEEAITLIAPPFVGEDADSMAKFLIFEFFGKAFWSNDERRNVVHASTMPAVILFTIEGSDYAYPTNPGQAPVKLPYEATKVQLIIAMENAKSSYLLLPRFRITSWDKFDTL